jgi:hypothetical protein
VQALAENIWVWRFPLVLLGTRIGRVVTVIRLERRLLLHSTAPFSAEDVAAIRQLGEPGWLTEATLFHDTFARQGCSAFPNVPYLAPEGFDQLAQVRAVPLVPPEEWSGEVELLELKGIPKIRETVLYHRPSRTLVVADLVFNLGPGPGTPAWTRLFMRCVGGVKCSLGMSRFFRFMIRDREAFQQSLRTMMEWDFDRLIVAHGDVVENGAKEKLKQAFAAAGF